MASQSQINQPNVQGTLTNAFTTVENQPQKILVVGQKISGTATADALVQNVQNNNLIVNTLFGYRSMVAGIIRNIRKVNGQTQIDVISLADNGSGVSATGAVVVAGTATEAGTLTVTIGSALDHQYEIAVANTDTATTVGTAIAAAITADTQVPVTAVNTTGSVAITASNKGTVGNSISLRIEGTVAGLTHSVTVMASGATDPSFTGLFDVVDGIRYQNIVWPYTADLTTVKSFIDPRFNFSGRILDGRAVVSVHDTFANLSTLGNLHNDKNLKIIGDLKVSETSYKGAAMLELGYGKAAQDAGIRALRLTDGANIASLVIANMGSLDRFGGKAIASLPYFNTPLAYMPLVEAGDGFSEDEIDDLVTAGISVWGNNLNNTDALMGEQVTTYKTDVAANPDSTFKYEEYDDTGRECREFYFNNYRARFNQHRLTQGAVIPGRAMANADNIRRFSKKLYKELADDALVVTGLLSNGQDALEFYDENLVITLTSDTTATITMVLPIVTQLRNILYTIELSIATFE